MENEISASERRREQKRLAQRRYTEKHRDRLNAEASARYAANKEAMRERSSKYYAANKEKVLAKDKVKRDAARALKPPRPRINLLVSVERRKEKNRLYARQKREADPDAYKAKMREYMRNRRKTHLPARIAHCLRGQIGSAIRRSMAGRKRQKTLDLCGCSLDFLISHLESQFIKPMTWDNYGCFWHIDHIVPLAAFDLTRDEDMRRACHYSNLQPMEAVANRKKSASIHTCQPELLIRLAI